MGANPPIPIITPPTNPVVRPSLTRYEYIEEGSGRSPGSVANVQEFGAQGDGVNDDTSAIQAAINAVDAQDGGIVYFPSTGASYYKITSGLTVSGSRTTLAGDGLLESRIHLVSATGTVITANASESGLTIRDLMLTSWSATDTRTAGTSITVQSYGNVLIENCWLRCGWNALDINGASTVQINGCVIDDLSTVTGGGLNKGIILEGGTISVRVNDTYIGGINSAAADTALLVESGADTTLFRGVEIVGEFAYGIRVRNIGGSFDPRWIRMADCFVEPRNIGGVGVELGACEDVEIRGLYAKGGQNGMHVSATSKRVRVFGGVVQLAQQWGILVDGCVDLLIDGTLVSDCSQQGNNAFSGIVIAPDVNTFRLHAVRSGNVIWNGTGGFGAFQQHGINIIAGTSDNYMVTECDTRSNNAAGLVDGGTGVNKVVTNNLP